MSSNLMKIYPKFPGWSTYGLPRKSSPKPLPSIQAVGRQVFEPRMLQGRRRTQPLLHVLPGLVVEPTAGGSGASHNGVHNGDAGDKPQQ